MTAGWPPTPGPRSQETEQPGEDAAALHVEMGGPGAAGMVRGAATAVDAGMEQDGETTGVGAGMEQDGETTEGGAMAAVEMAGGAVEVTAAARYSLATVASPTTGRIASITGTGGRTGATIAGTR